MPTIAKRYPAGIWRVPIDPEPSAARAYATSLLFELLSELRPGVQPPTDLDALRRQFVLATSKRQALFVFEDLEDPVLLDFLLPGPGASAIVTSSKLPSSRAFDTTIGLDRPYGDTLDLSSLSDDARRLHLELSWFIGVVDRADAEAVSGWTAARTQAALDELAAHGLLDELTPPRYRVTLYRAGLLFSTQARDRPETLRAYVRRVLIDWRVPPDDPNVRRAVSWVVVALGSKDPAEIPDEDWELLRGGVRRLSAWPGAPAEIMEIGEAVAAQRGDFELLVVIYAWHAKRAEAEGELSEAKAWQARRLDALERAHGPAHEDVVRALLDLARIVGRTDIDASRRNVARAVELADQLALPELQVRARVLSADFNDDPRVAEAALARALELAADHDPDLLALLYGARARLARQLGALEDARSWIERALELDLAWPWLAYELAELAESLDDLDLATRALEQALFMYELIGDDEVQAHLMADLGEIAIARGDLQTAQDWLERGLALDEQLGQPGLALVPLARLDRVRGDLEAAVAKLIRAFEELREVDTDVVLDELRACYAAAGSEPERARLWTQWEQAGLDWEGVLD